MSHQTLADSLSLAAGLLLSSALVVAPALGQTSGATDDPVDLVPTIGCSPAGSR